MRFGRGGGGAPSAAMAPPPALRKSRFSTSLALDALDDDSMDLDAMQYRGLAVSSKGNISATFTVPGTITIPSDGVAHNVTIVQLNLDSTMSWVSVPKVDAKTHLNVSLLLELFLVLLLITLSTGKD